MNAPGPQRLRLPADRKSELRRLGLTQPQIEWIDRKLPSIGRCLAPAPRLVDVRKALDEANESASSLLRLAMRAQRDEPVAREALAHLQGAAGQLPGEPIDSLGEGTLPEVLDFVSLSRALREITDRARKDIGNAQRRGRYDAGRAVQHLIDAIDRPRDAKSREVAASIDVVRAPSKKNPFGDIAIAVFSAATGNQFKDLRASVDAWSAWRESMKAGGAAD